MFLLITKMLILGCCRLVNSGHGGTGHWGLPDLCQKACPHTAEAGLGGTIQENIVLCRDCRGSVGQVGLVRLGGGWERVVVTVECF